jgi:uncharacterized damage-inducible protein DinB
MSSSLGDHFRAMARNNLWSNHRLHGACAKLSVGDYQACRTSFFPTIHATLCHILIVDWYYLDALEGGGRGPALYANDTPFAELSEVTRAQTESDRRLLSFCDRLDEASLGARVVLDRGDGLRYVETASDVLSHLFVHQIHHRGQVHAMLAGTLVPPPQLDEFFLEQDAPLRAAELADLGLST